MRFSVTMKLGSIFAENYRPWLADARGDIDWFYWDRYKRLLAQKKYSPYVIQGLDTITDKILDHTENPKKDGKWSRKGMVVGHVQSGKTANYIGLVNKAADSGYRVIIVLAGTLNALRRQTQERVDQGFLGVDTSRTEKPVLGVGLLTPSTPPAHFTTTSSDFKRSTANNAGVGMQSLNGPAILVVKKNPSTLNNLIEWLRFNNRPNLIDYPMLLIDDESDHASINTSKSGEKITAINSKIRELLKLFDRSSYVGYTATPFANIFIDPVSVNEMIGDDLFPRDFIISLDPPTNYVGASRIFSTEADLDVVRIIDDFEDCIPTKHKKGLEVVELPPSCEEAISAFVIARAIRILKGQTDSHNSMLVNVSRFTRVQSQVKLLVEAYVQRMRQAITNYSKLSEAEALVNPTIRHLKAVWEKEFSKSDTHWRQIQAVLKDAVSPVEIVEVNSSAAAASLDFSEHNYPKGRQVIAVGGLSLSRGLTLEGLTVSYFLRNSIMYDTLMQMGRWFGYRDDYEDVCRIYMSAETASWYSYISDVMEELREEFRRMEAARMTPRDFGLAVRSHPDSLIVTARNKMRTGKEVTKEIDLTGRLVETSVLWKPQEYVSQNLAYLDLMVEQAATQGVLDPDTSKHCLWRFVPSRHVLEFVSRFRNHPSSYLTLTEPLKEYIGWLETKNITEWDVLLVNPKQGAGFSSIVRSIGDLQVQAQKRSIDQSSSSSTDSNSVTINKRRVGTPGLERAGLSLAQIEAADHLYEHAGGVLKGDSRYRAIRERPLLMLHLLDIQMVDQDKPQSIFASGTAAYGISFPGVAGTRRPEKLVKYVVNTVWWTNAYSEFLEDDDDDLGIDE